MAMAVRRLIRATLPAAALAMGLCLSSGTAAADAGPRTMSTLGDPAHAALLNAGTVLSAVAPDGSIGLSVQTLGRVDPGSDGEMAGVEVAGITTGDGGAGDAVHGESTTGEPSFAALLNAATALGAVGPRGVAGQGVTALTG
jgi:hypothetical protein